jgi:hypothetical protein
MPVVSKDIDGDGLPEELTEDQKSEEMERADSQVALLCRDGDAVEGG